MTLRLRVLLAAVIALLITVGVSINAFAFTAQSGFSATTYATLPAGAAAGVACIGPVMYVIDRDSGNLYRVPAPGSIALVANIAGGPTALAVSGTLLYATRQAANDVVRIDPAAGAVTTIATSAQFADQPVNALAADPVTGDLYVTTASGYLFRIATPGSPAAAASLFFTFSGAPTYGIAVDNAHSLYVAVPGGPWNGVWQIAGGNKGLIDVPFAGGRGLGVVPGYVFSNNADGSIAKLLIPGSGSGSSSTALTGGNAGDLATIGTDGCFYASQGATVVRLADALGGCNLAQAAPPPPPPSLTLQLTSTNAPLIGNGLQTFTATLANASAAANVSVTFTVTRNSVTTMTSTVMTGPNGTAGFGYAAMTPGTDVISASIVLNGNTITSNAITLTWPRSLDTIPPIITYTVTGDHNAPGPNGTVFSCPNPVLGTRGATEYCGWYTSPPTVHFQVGPGGGPSGLAPYSCPDFTLLVDSPLLGTPVTCTASNGDGIQTAIRVVLQALLTPPTITASASTPSGPYVGGPTNENVTVTFACASDPALDDPTTPGNDAISFCTAPITVSAEGYTTVSGSVIDVAGTRANTSFGPILIDKTGPVITATMSTATDGLPYVPGTPTTQDVLVSFSCVDALDPHPVCPSPVRVSTGTSATATASDWAGNTTTSTFGGIVIDRTGPVVTAAITPAPDANGNNALTATLNVTATDTSGIGSITYSATGAQTIPATTVTLAGRPTPATVPVVINAIGTTTVSWSAADALGNMSATGTTSVHVISTQPTTLGITSASALPQGGTVVTARLLGLGGVPAAGKTVAFTIGGATVSAVTEANGVATATLSIPPGSYTLGAAFAGVTGYLPSAATAQTLVVFGPTQFVVWGDNAGAVLPGQRVIFWGEHWWDSVQLAEKLKVKEFKGWADTVNGTTWRSKGGDSKPPETISSYISVIVSNRIEKIDDKDRPKDDKSKVEGHVVGHAILRVASPYKDEPGKPVYGVVVAVIP